MKNARLAAAFAAILVALTGCSIEISTNGGGDSSNSSSGDTLVSGEVSTEKSYTYSVDNGDDIKIGVNTSLGYDITSEVPFTISKNGETAFQGSFIYSYAYEDYRDAYEAEPTAVFLGEGTKDGNEYFAYSLPDEIWHRPWIKALLIGDRELLDKYEPIYRRDYDSGYCVRSGSMYLDVVANGVSKGKALTELAGRLGIDRENIYAVGDNMNDVDMLMAAGNSFAVENAEEAVKTAADRIVPSCENSAVAYIIENLIS